MNPGEIAAAAFLVNLILLLCGSAALGGMIVLAGWPLVARWKRHRGLRADGRHWHRGV